jgi:hypothetical protein
VGLINLLIGQAKETSRIFLVAEFDTWYELQLNTVTDSTEENLLYVYKVCTVSKKINNEDSGMGIYSLTQ